MKGCTIKHSACGGGFHFFRCRMEDILLGCDMLATRWVLAWGSILWAVFLWWPGSLFPNAAEIAAGEGRTTYALMAQIAPEHVWGFAFGLQGVVMLWALIYARRNKVVFYVDAILGALLWTVATFACFAAHFHGWSTYQPPAAMSAEVVLTVLSWWHLVRYWADNSEGE